MTGEHLPVTLGHELCGRVKALPDGYSGSLKVGKPVMVDPRLVCRGCDPCKSTGTVFCERLGFVGLSGRGGGLSETVAVEQAMCYPLDDNVDLSLAALIEPLAVARHAVKTSGFDDFSNLDVLILGGGPIGQSVAIDLKSVGVKQVIVSEPAKTRREQIAKLSDHVIDAMNEDVPARCRELTSGKGIDVVFDCAGVTPAMNAAFTALKIRGSYVNVAGWETPFAIPMWGFMAKEILVRGCLAYDEEDFAGVVKRFSEGTITIILLLQN